ncbi:MAG: hypothetical protein EZS28_036446 [Streblomastix strix]|uniref:Uncharacterized protein n=1 Tax=Streblomastix strix TaxID=222440 RepID=A0A5J4UBU6_9EUKA|nr:MAG: hypothetical protein EZS28_036446 [Streblomastix strix]
MDLDEMLLKTYAGHARNLRSTNQYYIFARRLKDNQRATKLPDTRGQVEYNSISSTQQKRSCRRQYIHSSIAKLGLLIIRGYTIIYINFALVPPISLKLYRNAFIQFFTLVSTLCDGCESIIALFMSYSFFITSPFNLREMLSCNIDKQVGELLAMVSNKLVGMRCQQSFMGGYAHAVR